MKCGQHKRVQLTLANALATSGQELKMPRMLERKKNKRALGNAEQPIAILATARINRQPIYHREKDFVGSMGQ
jgi:hypothetical protein